MNTMGLAPLIFIALVVLAVLGFAIIITSLKRFKWFMDIVEKAAHTVRYTVYGIGMSGVTVFLYVIFETLRTATRAFDPIWYLYAVIAYVVLTALGWVGAKAADRVRVMHAAYTESKKKEVEITGHT